MASSTFPNDITPPIAQANKRGRPRFVARSSAEKVQERAQRLYSRQLEGQTTRQLVIEHSKIEQISITTAWEDWGRVKTWNTEDWDKDRENMLPRLQAMRVRLFNKAVKKGQLQTAAQILDSLCLLYTSPSPRDRTRSRMPSSA